MKWVKDSPRRHKSDTGYIVTDESFTSSAIKIKCIFMYRCQSDYDKGINFGSRDNIRSAKKACEEDEQSRNS